ncbi:MAG: signal peptidase I [Chloroflexi bacterium]|nr:signal peptidase I [Chloroflexota bacterium]
MKKMNTAFASAALLMLGLACGIPQEQFDDVRSELQGTRADLVTVQTRITGLEEASRETADVIATLRGGISDLQVEVEVSNSLLREANAGLEAAGEQLAQKDRTLATLSTDLESRNDDIVELRLTVDGLEDSLTNSADAFANLEQTLADSDAALQDSLQEAADLGVDLTLLDATNTDLRRQVTLTEAANEGLNGRVEVLQAQVDENSAEVVQAEIEDLKSQRDALAAKVNQLSALTEEYVSDPKVEIESSGLACTGSMLPLLHCGDMVIMQTNLKRRDVQVGDIISFRRRDCFTGRSVTDSITLHRVVDIDAGWFVTRGDNNYTVDSCRLPLNNVTGKLLAYIEDIYPEHYMGTANYEAIKANFNELQELFNRDLSIFREQEERLEDAEDEYNDGRISYSRYVDVWEDTRDDRISLLGLLAKRDDLADTFFGLQDLIIQRNYNDADWAHLVD